MTAVIYARYSSDNQREESIEGQIRECTAYAKKNGIMNSVLRQKKKHMRRSQKRKIQTYGKQVIMDNMIFQQKLVMYILRNK